MADRYGKDNILEYPKLAPERHYESENPPPYSRPSLPVRQPDKMLETLDDLDNLYRIADLLPPDLAQIIKEITDVLSKHSQGLIIMRLKRQMNPPYDEPGKAKPKKPPEYTPTPSDKPKHNWDDDPLPPPGPTEPEKKDSNKPEPNPWPPSDVPRHKSDQWPLPPDHPGSTDGGERYPDKYITGGDDGGQTTKVITGGGDSQYVDADVDDIFSSEPDVEINVIPSESLVDLARKAYEQDDADIKEHYTSEMTTISQRFFQVMTALAEDSNMLDYSDLMQPFDGTAVTTSDPNQQHLIDEICKNDVMYDQSLRQMNLTHTAAKTLVMTRGMTAAEGERERYLKSEYKTNMPSVVAGLSNDILQKNRESAEKKYKESSYNMYKYLDSAAKMTNAMLNMKIDSAIAKGQLANTGSNIFAYTPLPQPLPDDVDDNYDTVKSYEEKSQKFLDDQKKDQKKASEIDKDTGGSSSSSSGSGATFKWDASMQVGEDDHHCKVAGAAGKGMEVLPDWAPDLYVRAAKAASETSGLPVDWLFAQFYLESGGDPKDSGSEKYNYGNVASTEGGWMDFESPEDFGHYFGKYIRLYNSPPCTGVHTFRDYLLCIQQQSGSNNGDGKYCASNSAEGYADSVTSVAHNGEWTTI